MKIPASIDEINTGWLSQMLGENFPGTEVKHVGLGTVINGTATKVRLILDYNAVGHNYGLPATMWVKCGMEAHSDIEEMQNVYETEALFYRDYSAKLTMDLPKCYSAVVESGSGRSAMLLEDMLSKNASFGVATQPASPALAANVLTQLAKLHGGYWQDSSLKSDKQLNGGIQRLIDFLDVYLFTDFNWKRCSALPRGRYLPAELSNRNTMKELVYKLLKEDMETMNCLSHGDAHLGNVCILPGEKATFLDWQTAMSGHWAHDVSYFLTAALTIDDRRKYEKELISHYVKQLGLAGGKLDESTAWYEYRKHALYTCCWFPCNPEWQPEEIIRANSERAFAALADLKTLECF